MGEGDERAASFLKAPSPRVNATPFALARTRVHTLRSRRGVRVPVLL